MKYRIHSKIRSGAMDESFIGTVEGATGFQKTYAIKLIRNKFKDDQAIQKLFLAEAEINGSLQHRNLVNAFDITKIDDRIGVVMELVQGPDLEEILNLCRERNRRLPANIAVFICSEVARGLHYAHSATNPKNNSPLNLIHNEICPGNILISELGDVKITGFGVAPSQAKSTDTRGTQVVDKINYISPEQRYGVAITHASDLYSLGVVLWECLAGRKRYEDFEISIHGENEELEPELPRLRDIVPEIDAELEEIIAQATRFSPGDRIKSCRAFANILDAYLRKVDPLFTPEKVQIFLSQIASARLSALRADIEKALNAAPNEQAVVKAVTFAPEENDGGKSSQLYQKGKDLTGQFFTANSQSEARLQSLAISSNKNEAIFSANTPTNNNQSPPTSQFPSRIPLKTNINEKKRESGSSYRLIVFIVFCIGLLCALFIYKKKFFR
jgi:serine/threonine protein kinase